MLTKFDRSGGAAAAQPLAAARPLRAASTAATDATPARAAAAAGAPVAGEPRVFFCLFRLFGEYVFGLEG